MYIKADKPVYKEGTAHLRCKKGDISKVVLLPGDHARVEMFKDLLEDYKIISFNREFKVGTGKYKEVPITICSTGIGGPSTEIAVTELIELGAEALIRIGGCGAIREDIKCGEFLINTGSVRLGGSSKFYAMPEYPAVADFELVMCLKEASEKMNFKYHMGIGASTGSFYRGQGRNPLDVVDDHYQDLYKELQRLNVINMEMEAETIFTLSSIYRIKAASICVTHCNRVTNEWLVEYGDPQLNMCRTALEAVKIIYDKNIIKGE